MICIEVEENCVSRVKRVFKSTKKSRPRMKTLAQMRNGELQKLKKKRKLELCPLVRGSRSRMLKQTDNSSWNRKGESTTKKLINTKTPRIGHLSDSSKKENHEGFQGGQSIWSSSKDEKDNGGSQTEGLKRRRKHRRKKDKTDADEASQLQRRARYLLVKLKLEQNLIDAYLGEGWKGHSREKIKPEKEIQRAKKQILKCKLAIRDTVHQLDLLGSVGQIDDSLIAPDGSVHHEHIFCKKCKSQEVSEDNDIILCDGTCNCAFHQKCIDPPLATKDIPPEDEGWLCKYCDCKMEILEAMNAHLGTQFSADSTWQDIFKEEALLSDVGTRDFNPQEDWPDDESDDNDYDPDRDENNSSRRSMEKNSDSHEESSSSSSCCSLESEVDLESGFSIERNGISSNISALHQNCGSDDHEIISGPRQRTAVDYRKLYDEMFGKDTATGDLFSEDEDWDPRKRRRRQKECDAASTLVSLCESEAKHSHLQTLEVEKNYLPDAKSRKPLSRIPCDVVQKLRQAFAENELPSRAVKKKISELVGLHYEKVNKWFKNARYAALKNRKRRASDCSPSNKYESEVDKTTEVNVLKCSSTPVSIHEKKRLKKVSWNTNLTTFLSPLKQQQLKNTSLGNTKANEDNEELSDDMSLKKHLLYLKAKSQRKKTVKCDTEHLHVQSAEMQMQQLCRMEAKLWKLKQVLSTIHKAVGDEQYELCLNDQRVVYVPIAVLKEKV